ncbi:GNAT family N-acetyltransferase [Galactobacter valiniphilus]|uniref:GNAT family N-acetyltransferase n=1 Tax=Galactobacter valiniphilus TaxID=2676122 RepID=UPI0037351E00
MSPDPRGGGSAPGWELRPAAPRDVARVLALYGAEGRDTSAQSVAAAIADDDACALIARDLATGALLGFGKTHRWELPAGAAPAGLYLGGSLVRSTARRRGIGLALVEARAAWAAQRGEELFSVCAADNAASAAMHAAAGFTRIGAEPGLRGVVEGGREGLLWRAPAA